jgi:hypothetical protein
MTLFLKWLITAFGYKRRGLNRVTYLLPVSLYSEYFLAYSALPRSQKNGISHLYGGEAYVNQPFLEHLAAVNKWNRNLSASHVDIPRISAFL